MSWAVDGEMSRAPGVEGVVAEAESGIPAIAEDDGAATQQGGAADAGRLRQGRQGGATSPLASPLSPRMRGAWSDREDPTARGGRPASAMSGNMFARPLSRHQARAFSRMSQRSIEVSLDVFRAEIEVNRSLRANQSLSHVSEQLLPRADPVFKTKRLGSVSHVIAQHAIGPSGHVLRSGDVLCAPGGFALAPRVPGALALAPRVACQAAEPLSHAALPYPTLPYPTAEPLSHAAASQVSTQLAQAPAPDAQGQRRAAHAVREVQGRPLVYAPVQRRRQVRPEPRAPSLEAAARAKGSSTVEIVTRASVAGRGRLDAEWERLLDDSMTGALEATSPEAHDAEVLERHRQTSPCGIWHRFGKTTSAAPQIDPVSPPERTSPVQIGDHYLNDSRHPPPCLLPRSRSIVTPPPLHWHGARWSKTHHFRSKVQVVACLARHAAGGRHAAGSRAPPRLVALRRVA